MKKLSNNKGSAILITIALMLIISIVAISAVDQATTDVHMSYNQIHKEQAFYIAEAGLKRAIAEIAANPLWDTGFVNTQYDNGIYTVSLIDSTVIPALDDTVIVRSVATLSSCKAGVETWLVPLPFNPFEYSMFGDELVDIRNSLNTDSYNSDSGSYAETFVDDSGSIGSNGDIIISNGALVEGDAETSFETGLDINTGAVVTGDTTSTAPTHEVESIPDYEYDWAETVSIAETGITGSYDYDPVTKTFEADNGNIELDGGVYYFSSFVLDRNASLSIKDGEEVTIYIEGDIVIQNTGDINSGGTPSDLVIYSTGDLNLNNNGTFTGVFYCPDGSADLSNSSDFFGAIIANDIIANNSADFHYDQALGNFRRDSQKYKQMVAWREIEF